MKEASVVLSESISNLPLQQSDLVPRHSRGEKKSLGGGDEVVEAARVEIAGVVEGRVCGKGRGRIRDSG